MSDFFSENRRIDSAKTKIGRHIDYMILLDFFWKCNYNKPERSTKRYIDNERTKHFSFFLSLNMFTFHQELFTPVCLCISIESTNLNKTKCIKITNPILFVLLHSFRSSLYHGYWFKNHLFYSNICTGWLGYFW